MSDFDGGPGGPVNTFGVRAHDWSVRNTRRAYALFFNFLLYLVSEPDDSVLIPEPDEAARLRAVSNPKKKRRLEKQLRSMVRNRYFHVGSAYARSIRSRGGDSEGSRLQNKTLVRGHWRHQWYGPRRAPDGSRQRGDIQKLLWIQPFWKGEGEATW